MTYVMRMRCVPGGMEGGGGELIVPKIALNTYILVVKFVHVGILLYLCGEF